jgi:bacillolysin
MQRTVATITLLGLAAFMAPAAAQRSGTARVAALTTGDVRTWDAVVTDAARGGSLRLREALRDPALPARTLERYEQRYQGVPVWGSEIVRDSESGVARAIFGELTSDLAVETTPELSPEEAEARFTSLDAGALSGRPRLVIVPTDVGRHRLAYEGVVSSRTGSHRVFIDAASGVEILRHSEWQTQSAVGTGRGVLGDTKKLSVLQQGGAFFASDELRPPSLTTYDLRGNLPRAVAVVSAQGLLFPADLASDADNSWTDAAQVDAHVHAGWTYDYYFKRFGRRGLDDRDRPIVLLTNAVSQQAALTLSADDLNWALNAMWCGTCGPGRMGLMFFGNGLPPGQPLGGKTYTYFAGALDIVAHEMTHGVIESSSRLIYRGESGALNEAFADIMGTSVEFYYHPSGSGLGRADYLMGEDISRAAAPGARDGDRSMANPTLFGDPDHYARRYVGAADSGGVHHNSGIANHAFYLAVEGGTNRTSGLTVQGVGAANREQIERVFYRAFVYLLTPAATFSAARATTIQAARDLYGTGSAAERAVTQAWTAVGVS